MKFFMPDFDKSLETIRFKPTAVPETKSTSVKNKKVKKKNKNSKKLKEDESSTNEATKKVAKSSKPLQGRIEKPKNKKSNKSQQLKLSKDTAEKAVNESLKKTNSEQDSSSISAFAAKLKEQLKGGRFRFINEQLYTMSSRNAAKIFEEDPEAFHAYHEGYRHQIAKWPLNPLKRIIKMINRLPKSLEIGDFGCGEGQLAQAVPHKVYSLDLVSCRNDIIACDMAQTPLKTHSLDVAVYCLSLMGTNLNECFMEANRVLKVNGFLYIAEIQSRFDDVTQFVRQLNAYGFELIKQDVGQNIFYFFQFKKTRNIGLVAKVPQITLKPCLYKKR
uniref:Ribosomal RNA-processing protein 8 n=1 Tax=Glossina morsitans morsitans TaxID=37546 RepID=A0A1B0FN76_GLOMM